MTFVYFAVFSIVLRMASTSEQVVRVIYKDEEYIGFGGEPNMYNDLVIPLIKKDDSTFMGIYKGKEKKEENVLPIVADNISIVAQALQYVDYALVPPTDVSNFKSENVIWSIAYISSINPYPYQNQVGLKAALFHPTPVVILIATNENRKPSENLATLFAPTFHTNDLLKPETYTATDTQRYVMLEFKDELNLAIQDLTAAIPKSIFFVRSTSALNSDCRRMVVVNKAKRFFVGKMLSNKVLFWIQHIDLVIRYLLLATIDELVGYVTIHKKAKVIEFDTFQNKASEVTVDWTNIIKTGKTDHLFGIYRRADDFKNVKNIPETTQKKDWSNISLREPTKKESKTAAEYDCISVFFRDFAIPV